jgi:hypothetical protein
VCLTLAGVLNRAGYRAVMTLEPGDGKMAQVARGWVAYHRTVATPLCGESAADIEHSDDW